MTRHTHNVFVYGSLKKGFGNHGSLLDHGARLVAEGITREAGFTMENMGHFPAVVPGGNEAIWGEVYAVTADGLFRLDRLEGHPHFYQREEIDIVSAEGPVIRAWAYLLPGGSVLRRRPHEGNLKERIELVDIDGITVANWLGLDWEQKRRNMGFL